jgi:hypothetical protein
MLLEEIIAMYFENWKYPINTISGQNAIFFIYEKDGI